MPYSYLRSWFPDKDDRARVVDNLVRLRAQLDADVPRRHTADDLLTAPGARDTRTFHAFTQ